MQPHRHGPPEPYPPALHAPQPPSAVSRRPIVVGSIGVVASVVGLLLNAGSVAWVSRLVGERTADEPGGVGPSVLLAMQHLLMVVALLFALVLVSRRRDAGRSAALWIAVGDMPWLGLTVIALVASYSNVIDEPIGARVSVIVIIGLFGAAVALAGVGATVIGYGAPAGRRWLAQAVFAAASGAGPALPPPLRATAWRFGLSAGLGVGGAAALVGLIPLSQLGQEEGAGLGIALFSVLLAFFVGVPVLLGTLGAWRARHGRRAGAIVARVGGGFAVIGFPVFTLLGVFMVATSHYEPVDAQPAAPLPPAGVAGYGVVAVAVSIVAFALYIAGLAGLADPRSGRYLRSRSTGQT